MLAQHPPVAGNADNGTARGHAIGLMAGGRSMRTRQSTRTSGLTAAPLWCHSGNVEKRKPSFDLARFKAICGDPRQLTITGAADGGGDRLRAD